MALQGSSVVSITSAAPAPVISQPVHAYTDIIYISIDCSDSERKFSGPIDSLLNSVLLGCGTVDLVSLTLKFKTTATGQTVMAGFCETGSSQSIFEVSMKQNGFSHTSNSFNTGTQDLVELIPEDTFSTQLRPVPSDRPTIKLHFACSKGVCASLICKVKVLGMRSRYVELA